MSEFDFESWDLGESSPSRETGKPIAALAGDAAVWFVNRAAAQGISAAVESPDVVHAEYSEYAVRDMCASARDLLTDVLAEVQSLLDMDDVELSEQVRVIANSSRTAVSARVSVRADRPRGEYGNASVSFKVDGPLKSALVAVAPAAQKRSK